MCEKSTEEKAEIKKPNQVFSMYSYLTIQNSKIFF